MLPYSSDLLKGKCSILNSFLYFFLFFFNSLIIQVYLCRYCNCLGIWEIKLVAAFLLNESPLNTSFRLNELVFYPKAAFQESSVFKLFFFSEYFQFFFSYSWKNAFHRKLVVLFYKNRFCLSYSFGFHS